ncbi:hypothetical protein C1H46_021258 [Malus baccata]|uniref:Enolase C-terminal domain-containing protein n=1 Tax=Malus baccata TaxID=106549 RepID=A0A540M338_MALBA|nr:hypothetical protein C1H46_021258 [Malus baccata]
MARGPCLSRAQRGHRRRPSYSSTQTPAIFDSLKSFFFLHSHLFPLKLCHFYLLFRIIFVFKAVGGVRFDGPEIEVGEVSETEDGDLVIETGVTWTLTPALNFPQGLEKIREAVEELKLNPPSTCTGIHSYPLFFMGKDVENPSYKSLYVNETRGVFGIGAAVHFAASSSSSSFKRLVLVFLFALVDFDGTPTQVAHVVASLVEEGFTAVAIQAVRQKVGYWIQVRADANRNWTYEEAIQFESSVKDCDLQYLEEPVQNEGDIIRFCEESGLFVALDETIDSIREHPLDKLDETVIKPSVVVGCFGNTAIIAQWAQQHQKMAVVSAAFESGLAHGLGTYHWLKEDVTTNDHSSQDRL